MVVAFFALGAAVFFSVFASVFFAGAAASLVSFLASFTVPEAPRARLASHVARVAKCNIPLGREKMPVSSPLAMARLTWPLYCVSVMPGAMLLLALMYFWMA